MSTPKTIEAPGSLKKKPDSDLFVFRIYTVSQRTVECCYDLTFMKPCRFLSISTAYISWNGHFCETLFVPAAQLTTSQCCSKLLHTGILDSIYSVSLITPDFYLRAFPMASLWNLKNHSILTHVLVSSKE